MKRDFVPLKKVMESSVMVYRVFIITGTR